MFDFKVVFFVSKKIQGDSCTVLECLDIVWFKRETLVAYYDKNIPCSISSQRISVYTSGLIVTSNDFFYSFNFISGCNKIEILVHLKACLDSFFLI